MPSRWSSSPEGARGRSVLSLVAGTALGQLATIGALPILSRQYTPEAFGEYALFMSMTTLIAIVATFRYELAIVLPRSLREAVATKRITARLLLASSTIITILSCVTVAVTPQLPDSWRHLALLAGPQVFLLGLYSVQNYWFTRERKFGTISRTKLLQAVTAAATQVACGFILPTNNLGLALGLVVGQLAAVVMFAVADRSRRVDLGPGGTRRWLFVLRKNWRLPALTAPQALVDSFRINGINFAIGLYSLSALGQFSQATRLANVPASLLGTAIGQVFFPHLANTPREQLHRLVRQSVMRSLAIAFVPFLLIFLLSPWAFPWALGHEWAQAGLYAQALTPWMYLNIAASPVSTLFVILRKQHIGLPFSVFYAALPIVVLVLLHDDIYLAIVMMSLTQAGLLVVNLGLTFWIARRAPRDIQP